MATGGRAPDTFTIRIRFGTREPQEISINKKWTVSQLKQHIVTELGIESGQVDLIFAGKHVTETSMVEDLDLGDFTVMNAVKSSGLLTNHPLLTVNECFVESANDELIATAQQVVNTPAEPSTPRRRQCFYVYCRRACKTVQPAKLRVRCATCKNTTLTVNRDPDNWNDVLTPRSIKGECHAPNCPGDTAEFFFKCSGHQTGENETLPPLCNVVTNTREIPCILCYDENKEQLFVFDCAARHVMCLDCLRKYCETKIQDRNLTFTDQHGYTLSCPVPDDDCKTAYIKNPHTFKIAGDDLYQRYQKFANQEYVLKNNGVLCPGVNCGFGIMPQANQKKITCPECKHVFCRECKSEYHGGPCVIGDQAAAERIAQDPTVSPERAARARLECEAYKTIGELAHQCPKCHVNIDRVLGTCNHMTCTCGHQFCWECGKEWGIECQSSHWFPADYR